MSELLERMSQHLEWLKQNPDELKKEAEYCLSEIRHPVCNKVTDPNFKIKW